MQTDKVTQCEQALERLINRETIRVDADSYDEITYGLIEREAGTVSKGYIKHDREKFKSIVDRLSEHKAQKKPAKPRQNTLQRKLEQLQKNVEDSGENVKKLEQLLQIMMADNLKLVEKCKELELENVRLSSGKIIKMLSDRPH